MENNKGGNAVPARTVYKTSTLEKVAYGMGDVACNVVFAITSSLLVYFYTNVAGVSAALVGTILLASRIFDGISDLLMAQITDKVNSKLGKYRCWVLWMAVPYAVSAAGISDILIIILSLITTHSGGKYNV